MHHGAGTIARRGSIYSSRLKHLPIEGPEAFGAASLLNKIRNAIVGDDPDQRPHSPVVLKSLGGGVCCRIPLMVAVDEIKHVPPVDKTGPTTKREATVKLSVLNRSTRLATVANCWGPRYEMKSLSHQLAAA